MENYERLGTLGEGTYGVVLKCRHKPTGQIVAIKKFKEAEDDDHVRKTALREVRFLKELQHENIVKLIEVFRRKGKLYLVFEYIEHTLLEELEKAGNDRGLAPKDVERIMWELLTVIHFCHSRNIIHRDIKPENLLISKSGTLKICDFGFARGLTSGDVLTEYVSTRWYRAPELLVGDPSYGSPIDVWAIGCLYAEILTGNPLFPGDSDLDQLNLIMHCLGELPKRYVDLFLKNPFFTNSQLPRVDPAQVTSLYQRYPKLEKEMLDFLETMVRLDANERGSCEDLLQHSYLKEYREKIASKAKEAEHPIVMKRQVSKRAHDKDHSKKREKGVLDNDDNMIVKDRSKHKVKEGDQSKHRTELPMHKIGLEFRTTSESALHEVHFPTVKGVPKAPRLVAIPTLHSDEGFNEGDWAAVEALTTHNSNFRGPSGLAEKKGERKFAKAHSDTMAAHYEERKETKHHREHKEQAENETKGEQLRPEGDTKEHHEPRDLKETREHADHKGFFLGGSTQSLEIRMKSAKKVGEARKAVKAEPKETSPLKNRPVSVKKSLTLEDSARANKADMAPGRAEDKDSASGTPRAGTLKLLPQPSLGDVGAEGEPITPHRKAVNRPSSSSRGFLPAHIKDRTNSRASSPLEKERGGMHTSSSLHHGAKSTLPSVVSHSVKAKLEPGKSKASLHSYQSKDESTLDRSGSQRLVSSRLTEETK